MPIQDVPPELASLLKWIVGAWIVHVIAGHVLEWRRLPYSVVTKVIEALAKKPDGASHVASALQSLPDDLDRLSDALSAVAVAARSASTVTPGARTSRSG